MKTDNLWAVLTSLNKQACEAESELNAIEQSDLQARVADFHRACGLPVASEPTVGTPEQREKRMRLKVEELFELAEAMGVRIRLDALVLDAKDLTVEVDPESTGPDLVKMTHELGDNLYIDYGTAVEFGLPVSAAISEEIHPANMRKVGPDGKVVMVNGKVCKPEGWVPADVAKVLNPK